MPPTDLELLEIYVDALFTHDSDGRMISVNEPGGRPAPRFFFSRTSSANLWRLRHDLPSSVAGELEELATDEPFNEDLRAAPRSLALFQEALGNEPSQKPEYFGPAYRFPEAFPVPIEVTRITRSNISLLSSMPEEMEDLQRDLEAWEPVCAVIEDGIAVSVCYSSRLTQRAAAAGLSTLEGYRRRGFASVAVAGWASSVRAGGRIPMYDTSWENTGSQGVARKLGLIHFATLMDL
jgi:hypothetical protein